MHTGEETDLARLLAQERRARLAAERLLDQKQKELVTANRKLADHARLLSEEIVETREEMHSARDHARQLLGQNSLVRADLERAHRQASTAERRLWDALDAMRDGLALFDRDDRLMIANRAYMSLFDGLSGGPGRTYFELLDFIRDRQLIEFGGLEPHAWHGTMRTRWQQTPIPATVMKLRNGTVLRLIDRRSRDGDVVCLAVNITDTTRYEERLRDERHRAEAANRAKTAFLANMSH
jgi:PAS domain-containing protein